MSSIIVVFPKKEIATNIRNILVRNGFDVIGVGVTGAQAVQLADNLDDGIVVCGYKMTDMLYNELRDYLPSTIEMLLIASPEKCSDRTPGVISLSMPFKVFDLMNTIEMMAQLPADFHSCEVMGGRGSDFQWLVPLALANFTGTFVSRQPLLREGQAYAEIRRYGIYDATTVDEWSENNNDNS